MALDGESGEAADLATVRVMPASDGGVLELTEGLVQGRDEAYLALDQSYRGRLRAYLAVVCHGNAQAAEEALQETWLRVSRHARLIPTEPELWRWLATLARSAAVDGARRRSRYRAALDRYWGWIRGSPAPDLEEATSDAEAALEQMSMLLETGLEALSETERRLLVARYREHRSVRELAQEQGVTEKALESRLFRLRTQLRRELMERLGHEDT
jgi:RNA polymerase sigma-70 factor (ECF subfamily)